MRVSLFGLFLRSINLMESWPKLVQSDLLVLGFIRFCRFYVSLGDNWCCPIYFISRLITFPYLIIPWVFPVWYHLLCIYLLLHAHAHNTVFNAWLWFGFIDTLVLISARHLAFASPLAGEFWLLWILMSRSRSLDWRGSSCWGLSSLLRSGQTSCSSSPILAPPGWLAASPAISWAPFCTVHTCTSLWILALAPIGDVIFL